MQDMKEGAFDLGIEGCQDLLNGERRKKRKESKGMGDCGFYRANQCLDQTGRYVKNTRGTVTQRAGQN